MKLKRTLTVLTFSLIGLSSYGQKCEVKADPITGKQTIRFINKYKTLRFENNGGDLIDFYTTFNYPGEQNVSIPKGSQITFKLKNDKIVTLNSIKDAVPQTKVIANQYSANVITIYTFAFQLTKDDIETLASDKIVFMRYPSTDGGYLDYDVKGIGKIFPAKITKGAECMSENL